jgi:hypothetical protein
MLSIKKIGHFDNTSYRELFGRIRVVFSTAWSASYLDLHLEIDNERLLRTIVYDKRDDLNFSIVNFALYVYV